MTGLRVALVQDPAGLPAGWDAACRRYADRLGIDLTIHAAGPGDLQAVLRQVADTDGVLLHAGTATSDPALARAVTEVRRRVPVVHVDADPITRPRGPVREACDRVLHGRGRGTCRWALQHLRATARRPATTVPYGTAPDQLGDLRLPDGHGPHPVAVLLHGGFWLDPWARDLMDGLAVDLTDRGWATWNLEYRRLGQSGGGYPATFDDVVAGVAHLQVLARDQPLDLGRVFLVGHSAGGALAVWAATQPTGVTVGRVVVLAGVMDLAAAARDGLGLGSVATLLGDPDEGTDEYTRVSPVALAPIGASTLLAHGTADEHVPATQSQRYADVARAGGDAVDLLLLDGVDHFTVIDPDSDAWATTVTHLT